MAATSGDVHRYGVRVHPFLKLRMILSFSTTATFCCTTLFIFQSGHSGIVVRPTSNSDMLHTSKLTANS